MLDIMKILRSVGHALHGLRYAYTHDKSLKMEVNYGLPIFLLIAWCLFPFQPWEIIIFAFSYLLILLVELINTAVEKMIDRIHPDHHPLIGASKDIASSAVFIAFIFAGIVIFVLFATRLVPAGGGVLINHIFV